MKRFYYAFVFLAACTAPNPTMNNGGSGGSGGSGGTGAAAGTGGVGGMGGVAGTGGTSGAGGSGASGGSGGAMNVPEYLSGTRIKARVISTGDGAKQFLGWQDTLLNIPCSFMPTPDGMVRCVPLTTQMAAYIASSLYGDGNCQTPVAIVTGACPAALSYAYSMTYNTGANVCDVTYANQVIHLYAVTGQVTGNIFYNSTPGNPSGCMTETKNQGTTYWSVGAEVDYSTFAAGTVSVE